MTNEKTLTKAIEIAVENGWTQGNGYLIIPEHIFADEIRSIVFNHNFAKSLWGEKEYTEGMALHGRGLGWQFHLQQMVIAPDPLQYLSEHLPKD